MFACADFCLVPNHILTVTSLDTSGTWNVSRPATKTSTWDTYSALLFLVPVQAPLSSNQVQVRLATVTLKLQRYHSHRSIAPSVALVRILVRPW